MREPGVLTRFDDFVDLDFGHLPGALYHVSSRGDRREPIFEDALRLRPRTVLESNAKQADEHIELEDLRRATKVVARSLLDLLA